MYPDNLSARFKPGDPAEGLSVEENPMVSSKSDFGKIYFIHKNKVFGLPQNPKE